MTIDTDTDTGTDMDIDISHCTEFLDMDRASERSAGSFTHLGC